MKVDSKRINLKEALMQNHCEEMLKKAADELFALSLILALLQKGEGGTTDLANKGLVSIGKCQRLVRQGLGQGDGPTRH